MLEGRRSVGSDKICDGTPLRPRPIGLVPASSTIRLSNSCAAAAGGLSDEDALLSPPHAPSVTTTDIARARPATATPMCIRVRRVLITPSERYGQRRLISALVTRRG